MIQCSGRSGTMRLWVTHVSLTLYAIMASSALAETLADSRGPLLETDPPHGDFNHHLRQDHPDHHQQAHHQARQQALHPPCGKRHAPRHLPRR